MNFEEAIFRMQEVQTNGANYNLSTDDIIEILRGWSSRCDFEITEVDFATVKIKFYTLPFDLTQFCVEIYHFCPDSVEQGYGLIHEMVELAEETGEELDDSIKELIRGIDLEEDDYSLKMMAKDLPKRMELTLWWD